MEHTPHTILACGHHQPDTHPGPCVCMGGLGRGGQSVRGGGANSRLRHVPWCVGGGGGLSLWPSTSLHSFLMFHAPKALPGPPDVHLYFTAVMLQLIQHAWCLGPPDVPLYFTAVMLQYARCLGPIRLVHLMYLVPSCYSTNIRYERTTCVGPIVLLLV